MGSHRATGHHIAAMQAHLGFSLPSCRKAIRGQNEPPTPACASLPRTADPQATALVADAVAGSWWDPNRRPLPRQRLPPPTSTSSRRTGGAASVRQLPPDRCCQGRTLPTMVVAALLRINASDPPTIYALILNSAALPCNDHSGERRASLYSPAQQQLDVTVRKAAMNKPSSKQIKTKARSTSRQGRPAGGASTSGSIGTTGTTSSEAARPGQVAQAAQAAQAVDHCSDNEHRAGSDVRGSQPQNTCAHDAPPTARRDAPMDGDAFRMWEQEVHREHGTHSFVLGLHMYTDATQISKSGGE